MQNNLFYYATKELSQDAFICWLCSHAMEDTSSDDEALRECACRILCEFIGIDKGSRLSDVEIRKQYKNIDVLISVKCTEKHYVVIVEDKVHSSEHDDQLNRYKDAINSDYPDAEIICVYYKTGFQSDYSGVEAAGYHVFDRRRILAILGDYAGSTNNDIFKDYYEYWKNYEDISGSYKELPISEWNDERQVNGFYEYAQNELNKDGYWCGFDWVNNRGGGFWGLWYGIDDDHIRYEDEEAALYLQTEIQWDYDNGRYGVDICLKLERKDPNSGISALRDRLFGLMGEYGFIKPGKVRTAAHMTVGIYSAEYSTYGNLMSAIKTSATKYTGLIEALNTK